MPVLLINKNDFKEFKQISKGRDIELIEQYVTEAQDIDIRSLICDKFYFDILKNWQLPAYQKLIHGETYTDEDGVEIEYKGLKPVLVYYAYSRYCMRGSVVDTPFGMVQKTNENSQPISGAEKRDMRDTSIHTALRYWLDVKKYLKEKEETFPKWSECNECKSSSKSSSKFDVI
jgi:hypothetical protein